MAIGFSNGARGARADDVRANIADFALSIDGKDFTDKARPRLISLTLTQKRGGEADQLDLVLDDGDGKLELPPKNKLITLKLGWTQGSDVRAGLIDKGRFTVDEVSWAGPPDQVTIRARSADLTGAFRNPREKGHKDTTLGAIAKKVAGDNGLEAKVAPELADIPVPILTQHHQSDMALLRRLGREHDALATVKDRRLILSPIGKGETTSGKPLPAITLTRASGDRYRYAEIDRSADAGVEARWHDQDSAERKTVKVGGGGDGGNGGGGGGTPQRLRKIYHSEADAMAAAKAQASRTKRQAAEFSMTLALGDPALAPETAVTLEGFKPPADARQWIIEEVTHRLDGQTGLTTDLKLESKA